MQFAVLAAMAVAGGIQAKAQHDAGKAADIQYKQQAQQEKDAARDREIERRRSLMEALASQNAEAGALGAAPGMGSRRAIAISDAKRSNYDTLTDRASTGRRALMLREAGRNARSQGNLLAISTVASTVAGMGASYGGGKKTK